MAGILRKILSCYGGNKNGKNSDGEEIDLGSRITSNATKARGADGLSEAASGDASAPATQTPRQMPPLDPTRLHQPTEEANRKSHSVGTSSKPESDPDEITPVEDRTVLMPNVSQALEERQRLFQRLRDPTKAPERHDDPSKRYEGSKWESFPLSLSSAALSASGPTPNTASTRAENGRPKS